MFCLNLATVYIGKLFNTMTGGTSNWLVKYPYIIITLTATAPVYRLMPDRLKPLIYEALLHRCKLFASYSVRQARGLSEVYSLFVLPGVKWNHKRWQSYYSTSQTHCISGLYSLDPSRAGETIKRRVEDSKSWRYLPSIQETTRKTRVQTENYTGAVGAFGVAVGVKGGPPLRVVKPERRRR